MNTKLVAGFICAGGLWAGAALAQSPVTLTIDAQTPGAVIPANFIGLSVETIGLVPDQAGGRIFSANNQPLITLFTNLGIRHLRVGGGSVEWPATNAIPDETDIDNLFAFVRAAGVNKVIYSLRLLETNHAGQYTATNIAIVKYICSHYRPYLDCFAIGNEPDRRTSYKEDLTISNFTTYLDKWRQSAAALTNAVPDAKFAGPDAGNVNVSWTTNFAGSEQNSGLVTMVTGHDYAGGKGRGVSAEKGIETMLSPGWVKSNQRNYDKMVAVVLSDGLPFRFTEANDHYSGGIPDASDTFAGALWALDFLHWWAGHGISGVDFHNKLGNANDVIARDSKGQWTLNPKGYGVKAFDLGGHGCVTPLTISNPDDVNLTAYAVRGDGNLFITVINKEYGAGARAADVTIVADGIAKKAGVIFLTASDVAAKTGVTLGGAAIRSDGPWLGKWTPLESGKKGQCSVKLPAASAAIIKINTK